MIVLLGYFRRSRGCTCAGRIHVISGSETWQAQLKRGAEYQEMHQPGFPRWIVVHGFQRFDRLIFRHWVCGSSGFGWVWRLRLMVLRWIWSGSDPFRSCVWHSWWFKMTPRSWRSIHSSVLGALLVHPDSQ